MRVASFFKGAAEEFGAGGLPPAEARVNPSQGAPSHDFKEKPNYPGPEHKRERLVYDQGKTVPDKEPKISKQAFINGFFDELEKAGFGPMRTVQKTVIPGRQGMAGTAGRAGVMRVREPAEAGPTLRPSGVPTARAKREAAFFSQKPTGANPLM